MIELTAIQEEARKTLVYFGNRVLYSGALGKKDYSSLIKDQERLNYLYGVIANSYNPASIKKSNYGFLYNQFALAGLAPPGWHIPTDADNQALSDYLGGDTVSGSKLKEIGNLHWSSLNTDATNTSGFTFTGTGYRGSNGVFAQFGQYGYWWSSTGTGSTGYFWVGGVIYAGANYGHASRENTNGVSVRFIKDDSTDPLTFTDSDGNIYPTIKIGTQVWMASNLITTTLADGTPIANVTDNTAWGLLATGAYCSYNNDDANAYSLTNGTTYFIGDKEITSSFILKAIEMIRHFQCRATDLSAIGADYTPVTPPAGIASDLIRTGHKAVTIGAASVTFSSPLPSSDYTVTAWVIGTGESQYDLGTFTLSAGGFTVSDITINGTLHYQAIINI